MFNRTLGGPSRTSYLGNNVLPPPNLAPGGPGTRTNEDDSRFNVEFQDLDDAHPTMTIRLRPGGRIRNVDRAMRRYLAPAIHESDTLRFYKDGEPLRADDRLESDVSQLHYRVSRPGVGEGPFVSLQGLDDPNLQNLGSMPSNIPPILHPEIAAGMTVAQLRARYARGIGIADPNTIIVSARGGMRVGNLEGSHWEVRQVSGWLCQSIVFETCHRSSYLILRGYNKEYLYQTSADAGNGVVVENLKRWLTNRLIHYVHRTLNSQGSSAPATISLSVGQSVLSNDTFVVPWRTVVSFRLLPLVEKIFSSEEAWLCASFDCTICHESRPVADKAPRITADCTHERTVCKACAYRWVSICLRHDGWDKARCPTCSNPLDYHDVKASTSKDVFERYEMLATREALGNIPDFYWCLAEGCDSGQIHEPNAGDPACPDSLLICHACNGHQCTRHAVKWHEGLTCQEYERGNSTRVRQEKASKATVRGTSKQCPRCHRTISKEVGCNHMTCICGHEWCYLCLGTWTECERTNIPYCEHLAGCPERNENPFFGGRGGRRHLDHQHLDHQHLGYQHADHWDPDTQAFTGSAHQPVVRPRVRPPLPIVSGRLPGRPGREPPPPVGLPFEGFAREFLYPSRLLPSPVHLPPPEAPQFGLPPRLYPPWQDPGGFPSSPTPRQPSAAARTTTERRRQEYFFPRRLGNAPQQRLPEMNPQRIGLRQDLPPPNPRRPQVEVPATLTSPKQLAQMRSDHAAHDRWWA